MSTSTLTDVAKVAGVSIATASRALADTGYPMQAETRQRVLRAAGELNYVPNPAARGLRRGRTFLIGVILDDVVRTTSPRIMRGVLRQLTQAGYSMLVVDSEGDRRQEDAAIHSLVKRSVDGILFIDTYLHSVTETLPESKTPCVFINRRSKFVDRNSVYADNCGGAELAVQHLVDLGHRRIALINGPPDWDGSQERFNGYQNVLGRHGIPLHEELVHWGPWEKEHGYQSARQLASLPNRPTAIFGANDHIALGAIYAVEDAGLHVPDDVAVVGYDNEPFAQIVRPTLTTVSLPLYEMGEFAAQLLLDSLDETETEYQTTRVPGRLWVRESCGARRQTVRAA